MFRLSLPAALLVSLSAHLFAVDCPCDPAKPETMELRVCSLCREAEKQPTDVAFFFLKDASPMKPNRTLLLPRRHWETVHEMSTMTHEQRTALWTAAFARGEQLWGKEWGVAYNGAQVRTQCHLHIHIGKLLHGVELDRDFIVVSKPADIPVITGEGMWIHPVNGKFHVHQHEQRAETVLMR